ncbi:GyrI-like domain-containing protein [Iodobacter fluviatilis]|uniref:Bacterial transcription activator, effector binding domain n=1 Tax=Iodobacter fluviatilis TaxID=537 RepID=A0A377Q8Y3_9NEIS|nr:GyrI-like domain-containing protein [Iodobacter fluviatilis]TCU88744.1 putative transcriptional regulator YdeE [Iodobacter fluviatilis]STQ91185.1 Bacterial transcription activator, effector binding domain [Iodobacter fluviatilis]
MNPKRLEVSGFTVAGISVRTKNSDEFNPTTARIARLWQQFFSENLVEKIPDRLENSPVYGVYSGFESDANGFYDLTAGVSVHQSSDFTPVTIQPGSYLVFEGVGPMPGAVIQAWGQVWAYFEQNPQIKRSYQSDFESYIGPAEVHIYIGVAAE